MEELTPQRLADDYVAWATTGDPTMLQWFAPDFLDHVSGRTGPEIWEVVAGSWPAWSPSTGPSGTTPPSSTRPERRSEVAPGRQ
jgi:hypothetical protein